MEAVIARRAARLASGHSCPVTPEPSDEEVTPPRAEVRSRHREVSVTISSRTIMAIRAGHKPSRILKSLMNFVLLSQLHAYLLCVNTLLRDCETLDLTKARFQL